MNIRTALVSVLLLIVATVVSASVFTYSVTENQAAVKLSSDNKVLKIDDTPGLHFTVPFMERIQKLDKRVLSHDYAEDRYVTTDGQVLRVDCFVAWQIADPVVYYNATQGNDETLVQALGMAARSALKEMVAKRSLKQAVAADRNESVTELFNIVATASAHFGVKLIDVRVHKVGLPESYNDAVYTGMRNSFRKNAIAVKAQGDANAQEIRAQADRDRTEILANANRDAAATRGDGDAKAAAIYATAYRANPEFFSFYRSMQAYRKSIGKSTDVLVVSPDSEFFKYFNKPATR